MADDRPLSEYMREAMAAQGKVDPDDVFAEAEDVDLDDGRMGDTHSWPHGEEPPGHEPPPIDPDQAAFALDELEEDRGYGYEP